MKGIEKITARIAADAEAENGVIREEAERRCQEIRAEYDKKATETYEELLRTGLREAEQYAARIERTAQLDARKDLLALRQELVTKAFALAEEKLANLPEVQYLTYLTRQVVEASIEGDAQLVLNEKDKQAMGEKLVISVNTARKELGLGGQITLAEETRPMIGGCILKQGNVEANCTMDMVLELIRGELAAEVAKVLFED